MIELVLFIIGFILVSGFLAMIDAAILSVTPAEVEVLILRKRWGAVILKHLLRHTTRAIIVIVILTNVTNILGPILAGRKAEALFGSTAIGAITGILTFTTIIFSEIIPKAFGAHNAPRIARMAAPFIRLLVILLFPIVWLLEQLVAVFKTGKRKVGTEEQIRALANLGGGQGHIDADERELIHRAFVLNDRKASDIMTPIEKMISCPSTATIQRAAKMVFEESFSRYPITGDSINDIRGYLLSRDVLEALADGKKNTKVQAIAREIFTVKSSMRCDDLLQFLRKNTAQLAIVKDKEKTVGLVTLEDVLEELVGEIQDENDSFE